MKTKTMNYVLVPLALVMLLTIGLASVYALEGSWRTDDGMAAMEDMAGPRGEGRCFDGPPMKEGGRHFKMLAVALDFSPEQTAQLESIVKANREKMMALRQQLREGQQQLCTQMASESFDEVAFRAEAEKVAAARIDLMVNRAKTHQAIFAVMTAEQQAKAKKLKQAMSPRYRGPQARKGAAEKRASGV